jgi:hypothetical protein
MTDIPAMTDALTAEPDGKTLLDIYRRSALIRRCSERFLAVIRAGRIAAPYHSPRHRKSWQQQWQ